MSSGVIGGSPAGPRRSWVRRVLAALMGKLSTLLLALFALVLGIVTFVVLAGGLPQPNQVVGLVFANLAVLLLLGALLAARLTQMWMERRRGAAGARLHVRLVLLFGGVAVTPAIVVALFSTVFFHLGIQAWFNEPVRTALQESLEVSRGYAEEHRNNIRADALGMANDISRAGRMLAFDPTGFANFLSTQTTLRGLTEALIYEPVTGQVIASAGSAELGPSAALPPSWATDSALKGNVALLGSPDSTRVRAVVALDATPALLLMVGRPVDPVILEHIARTERAVAAYDRLDKNRSGLQITFALIFALVALLVLGAAVLIGLVIANQIARPVGGLIMAAERVRAGDLAVRVPEADTGDELAWLSRAFNRMTGQLAAQRSELMDAYSQIDARRRFTEAVLSGVSAGVIGLDAHGRIDLPNRAASQLLGLDLVAATGQQLEQVVPEFAPLLAAARANPARAHTAQVQIGPANHRRMLLLRIGADHSEQAGEVAEEAEAEDDAAGPSGFHFVATFDDITELQSAQRKAAWADVARRIAHEIKNPLTPIQLSAERLKRRFTREITSDPETFIQCADTIVRHVGEIGRMVDEFSAFARMPQPVIRPEDVGRVAREALVLQRTARPEIEWVTDIPERGPVAPCDRRLLGQALTNLLQNAADAVAMRAEAGRGDGAPESEAAASEAPARIGRIEVRVSIDDEAVVVRVADDGVGLPSEDRGRLAEPYVTYKPKGTGLGLAIVKKIMEDQGGTLLLDDREAAADWPGGGAVATLRWPLKDADDAAA